MLSASWFFQWESTSLASLFEGTTYVWEALDRIDSWLEQQLETIPSGRERCLGVIQPGAFVGENVILAKGAVVETGAWVKGPAYIGAHSHIRHGAYVREGAIVGEGCVVGHTSEIKTSILLDGSAAPHFNYVGDSILGRHCNLGAGVKLSNLKHTRDEVVIKSQGKHYPTGRAKLGAILGDGVVLGCNAVTNPGTLVGPGTLVYPNAVLRGIYPAHSIVKVVVTTEITGRLDQ